MIRLGLSIFIFFVLGALIIVSNENLQLADHEDLGEFWKLYLAWVFSLGENVRAVTGAVIASDWVPHSSSLNVSE